ncbi:hypothetical protein ACHAW6_008460 [Cyclotella cf. meneghiniana]
MFFPAVNREFHPRSGCPTKVNIGRSCNAPATTKTIAASRWRRWKMWYFPEDRNHGNAGTTRNGNIMGAKATSPKKFTRPSLLIAPHPLGRGSATGKQLNQMDSNPPSR